MIEAYFQYYPHNKGAIKMKSSKVIDMIVDSTIGHGILSFMDGVFGYNQIRISKEDQYKIIILTTWVIFYQVIMIFGLKNTSVTYQKSMMNMFYDIILDSV